jgi:hypothetical protein
MAFPDAEKSFAEVMKTRSQCLKPHIFVIISPAHIVESSSHTSQVWPNGRVSFYEME